MTFENLGLRGELLRAVSDLGFTIPTPIQKEAIPFGLEGLDLLACAMTGSGKTVAFGIPLLQKLLTRPKGKGARALVLTPTRELAAQVGEDLRDLAVHTRLGVATIYGGVAMGPQEQAFRKGVDILVATPGRLLDHLQNSYARLDGIEVLVLDEADRMLDMGFIPDIRRILSRVPKQRQTLFFSATMPDQIAKLAREMLRQPKLIAVERKAAPATGVRQRVFVVNQTDKTRLLQMILGRDDVRSVLAFTRTKHRANRLADLLEKRGFDVARIHGNRSQSQREKALDAFKRGHARVLVATDIAARGIDVDDLSHVVNFDIPNDAEDYIHRVGRTARANRTGDAITFVAPDELGDLRDIEKSLGRKIDREDVTLPPAPPDSMQGGSSRRASHGGDRGRPRQAPAHGHGGARRPAPAPRSGRPEHARETPRPAAEPPHRLRVDGVRPRRRS